MKMTNQIRKKLQLNKGDTIKCQDLEELRRYVNELAVERYDVTVDERALLITINGKYNKDGLKEAEDEPKEEQSRRDDNI